ncbi:hypothetical protein VTL71DRAFT_10297 [Oculimacula yallundae]|uniref:Uncharacterized protein n=1 Tax=Oculimacula yallundae TaxID=86028 RepID=A0ABR4CT75_9HELO
MYISNLTTAILTTCLLTILPPTFALPMPQPKSNLHLLEAYLDFNRDISVSQIASHSLTHLQAQSQPQTFPQLQIQPQNLAQIQPQPNVLSSFPGVGVRIPVPAAGAVKMSHGNVPGDAVKAEFDARI